MSLWNYISRKQLKAMAEMIQPPVEDRLVFKDYFIAIKGENEILELTTRRGLDSLLAFKDRIAAVSTDREKNMQIAMSPSAGILSIRIGDLDDNNCFALPHEVFGRVVIELGIAVSGPHTP